VSEIFEETIKFKDGTFCNYREYKWEGAYIPSSRHWCPLCNEEIEKNDITYLAINNFKLFPNAVIHKSCIGDKSLEGLTIDLKDKYEKYKKFISNNLAWIND